MAETADIQTQPFYLKKAKLKGYKSIKDAAVEFHDGLNIIIGKNASGKSNLLEFLFETLTLVPENSFVTDTELILQGLKELRISSVNVSKNKTNSNLILRNKNEKPDFKFVYDNQILKEPESPKTHAGFIRNNIPKPENSPIITSPFYFEYYSDNQYVEINLGEIESELLDFIIHQFLNVHHPDFLAMPPFKKFDIGRLKSEFISRLDKKINGLNKWFKGLIPIEEIRFNPNINIHLEKESGIYTFSNLFIEYKIKGNWLPYSNLSDGTKRLFYIISTFYLGVYRYVPKELYSFKGENLKDKIFLIEEPELGIHPHQLHQLMTFIKEQSRDKQIILSTHSPMVLDILGKDDLHRIIIASNDDPKIGSQFRHLTEKEMDKARLYMDGDFLSDYWKYSDLER